MTKFLRLFKNFFYSILIFLNELLYKPQIYRLETDKFYGINKKVIFVDQLGSPNLNLVTDNYGTINDRKAAKRFGTSNIKEYSYWSWRSCAVANVLMILKTEEVYDGTLYDLVKQIRDKGGYLAQDRWGNKDVGWKHQFLVNILRLYELKASLIKRVSISHLMRILTLSHYVIASVKSRVQKEGTHMILVTGFTKTEDKVILYYYDPMNIDKKGGKQKISSKDFLKIFLNKGIVIQG